MITMRMTAGELFLLLGYDYKCEIVLCLTEDEWAIVHGANGEVEVTLKQLYDIGIGTMQVCHHTVDDTHSLIDISDEGLDE